MPPISPRATRRIAGLAAAVLGLTGVISATGSTVASGSTGVATRPPALSGPRNFTVPRALMGMHVQESTPQSTSVGSARLTWESEWRHNEPQRGVHDWRDMDSALARLERDGTRDVLAMIGLTPDWATASGASAPNTVDPPADVADWESWVDAVSRRYAGRITAYQVWNEGNLRTFWTGTPEQLADLTNRAFSIIRRNDPHAKVVAASTTTRLPGAYKNFFPRYLAALGTYGWPVDVFAAHLYPPSTGTPLDVQKYVAMVKGTLRAAGAPYRQLWDTEVNYGLAGPGPAYPKVEITGDRAAAWVARTYLDSLRLGIQRTYWYRQASSDRVLGIQMWRDEPALQAQRTLATWLVGSTWRGCARSGVVVRCETTANGRTATIVWSETANGVVAAPPGTTTRCDVRGSCTPTRPRQVVALAELPVRFSG